MTDFSVTSEAGWAGLLWPAAAEERVWAGPTAKAGWAALPWPAAEEEADWAGWAGPSWPASEEELLRSAAEKEAVPSIPFGVGWSAAGIEEFTYGLGLFPEETPGGAVKWSGRLKPTGGLAKTWSLVGEGGAEEDGRTFFMPGFGEDGADAPPFRPEE